MTDSAPDRWTHPSAILVATDLSDLDRLVPFALRQSKETGAHLIVLHVVSAGESMSADVSGMPFYDPAGAIDIAARQLEACCKVARLRGVACDAVVREGNPAQQILAATRQFHVDRLILGTRSRGKISKILLGSVAEQVLRSVNLPVITVGPEAHLPVDGSDQEPVVLHATTLREASRPSAALACRIASTLHGRLVLLHVLPHMETMRREGIPTELDGAAARELEHLARITSHGECAEVEAQVLHGNPAIEILSEAERRNASLIVMGATQHSAMENLTRDRTIYKVLAHARCPVLTLREAPVRQEDTAIVMAIGV